MSSPNLGIDHVQEGQSQKEVIVNDAIDALDLALTGEGAFAPGVTPDDDAFRRAFAWAPQDTLQEAATFPVPAIRRPFSVLNPSDTYTITVERGSDAYTVAPATAGWFYCDGSTLWRLGPG